MPQGLLLTAAAPATIVPAAALTAPAAPAAPTADLLHEVDTFLLDVLVQPRALLAKHHLDAPVLRALLMGPSTSQA
eukprot:CAMPEP_0177174066 /NCGR_PEP_ID=MMETSP0367-20130122/11980_1 /TAXON_ID=447022 ORGANISM="Scrippsiella hangoei-like, Strain SHHI-4" /NCGR_SAMPLE_ID=MMETSP0367 /ASSEMBLY_ACC=CAM_ASM_000362 /LENGTH=75 /DNA_ID=CAMNT_0018620399 /DNA_START=378 /DNA_END=602 /DNA_ORIENTATION=-